MDPYENEWTDHKLNGLNRPEDDLIFFVALRDIASGEELSFEYIRHIHNTLDCTADRSHVIRVA